MALSNNQIRAAAERLQQAETTKVQIRQLSLDHPAITIPDAYAIQGAWIEIKQAAGRRVRGHKIGLTSKAMQGQLGIDEPDSGILLDDMTRSQQYRTAFPAPSGQQGIALETRSVAGPAHSSGRSAHRPPINNKTHGRKHQ